MALLKKLTVLAGAAGAARAYAKKNPEKVNQAVGKAAKFVDDKTKGKYHDKIAKTADKAQGYVDRLERRDEGGGSKSEGDERPPGGGGQ